MMRVLVWNECYISGGADWSLIDLVTNWPDKDCLFSFAVNKTHEGLGLLRDRLSKHENDFFVFSSPSELAAKNKKALERWNVPSFVAKVLCWLWVILVLPNQYHKIIKNTKCDVLLINNGGYPGGMSNYLIMLVAKFSKVKSKVMIVRNYPQYLVQVSNFMKVIRQICQFSLNLIVCVSDSLRKSLIQDGGLSNSLLMTIHNGINVENKRDSSQTVPNDLLKLSQPRVGIIGGFEKRKGHELLLRAWVEVKNKFPTASLVIVGSKESGNVDYLIQLAGQLKINDSLLWLPYTRNIADVYDNLEVVVMPSLEYESFGRIVVEAMAFGKPIIASNVGGIPELIVNAEDGLLFDPVAPRNLSDAIIKILSDPVLYDKLVENGKMKFKKRFESKIMAEKYQKAFHQLASAYEQ